MFTDEDIIFSYPRAQALEDGALVAVDEKLAKRAGLKYPAACTAALWALVSPSEALQKQGQSLTARLWDLLWMFYIAARSSGNGGTELFYKCLFLEDNKQQPTLFTIKCVLGPDDNGDGCFTFMMPDED